MFPQLLEVKTQPDYRLSLKFSDGTEGVADVSHLAGHGVFRQWDENGLFFNVKIDPETNALVWNETLDLDPDNLYLQIRGLTFEQWKSMRKQPQLGYAAD